jgi:hypothetical protein
LNELIGFQGVCVSLVLLLPFDHRDHKAGFALSFGSSLG